MLTHHLPVSLSLVGVDFPVWSSLHTNGTIYESQKGFSLMLSEPAIRDHEGTGLIPPFRQLWLEVSRQRVVMTMQDQQESNYRHQWEVRSYRSSSYWLQSEKNKGHQPLRLRNYTHSLSWDSQSFPLQLRLEYDLWGDKIHLGRYVLILEIGD